MKIFLLRVKVKPSLVDYVDDVVALNLFQQSYLSQFTQSDKKDSKVNLATLELVNSIDLLDFCDECLFLSTLQMSVYTLHSAHTWNSSGHHCNEAHLFMHFEHVKSSKDLRILVKPYVYGYFVRCNMHQWVLLILFKFFFWLFWLLH